MTGVQTCALPISPRERQVFDLLVRGKPHKQISHDLGISERTVKLHRHQLVEKLKARSLADLVVIAERLGLLPEGDGTMSGGMHVRQPKQNASSPAT